MIKLVMSKLYGTRWLDKYKKALPRKRKKQVDEDVEAITEASFASEPADRFLIFMTRAIHMENVTHFHQHTLHAIFLLILKSWQHQS